ncbi:hypothetical protein AJ78_01614 [Emergomyces pasteurianus Ep9510]|uniref:Maltose/galactoside acetyltransferase domain-containing protein n=1 Tax=Emergomyces pasteurianus Ep9510 TaxID=1447872 RepID=A0A1J9PR31_9EURO|nr:hypothetical protein AJ78_01614 [Emergomyces pasteurianus Ep9510]
MTEPTEMEKMLRGEPHLAFSPELMAARAKCKWACKRFNDSEDVSRRRQVELWRDILQDPTPLPPLASDPVADEALFENEPVVEAPIRMDYGFNVTVGQGAFINFNCVIVDSCPVTIGARTLLGPNVSIYSGKHPIDPAVRNGLKGPDLGKEVHIGEDCWIGGNVDILPGVTIGRGVTVGAGSVVTKDVPAFHVVAGNPARILRRIETSMATTPSDPAVQS